MNSNWPENIFIKLPIIVILCFGFWGLGASYSDGIFDKLNNLLSFLGAALGAYVAIGLFQLQRKNDKKEELRREAHATKIGLDRLLVPIEEISDNVLCEIEYYQECHLKGVYNSDWTYLSSAITEMLDKFAECRRRLANTPRGFLLSDSINTQLNEIGEAIAGALRHAERSLSELKIQDADESMIGSALSDARQSFLFKVHIQNLTQNAIDATKKLAS